jgi:biotin carboxyl carrier protein
MKLLIGDQEYEIQPAGDTVTVDGESFAVRVVRNANIVTVYLDEKPFAVQLPPTVPDEGPVTVLVDAKEYAAELKGRASARPNAKAPPKKKAGGTGAVHSQMTGRVIRVDVKPGDTVNEGDILLVIEAMKMENEIAAPTAGTVREVAVSPGSRVADGDLLLVIEPAAAE